MLTKDEIVLNGQPKHRQVLDLLSDYRPHFSREFIDSLKLLEYRRRISDLRELGHNIVAVKEVDSNGFKRPAYRLLRPLNDQDLFVA